MSYLERAITDGHAKFSGEGKQQKIIYVAVNHTEHYADPEEQVRAEFWAELIYRYGYEPARVGVEVTVPDRTPSDNEVIFMAVPELIGYDATGSKCDNQLPEVAQQFRKFQRDAKPFFV